MDAISLSFLLASPWLVLITLGWAQMPRDHVPPSMADLARRRLWST
jgi:hypothetical protein